MEKGERNRNERGRVVTLGKMIESAHAFSLIPEKTVSESRIAETKNSWKVNRSLDEINTNGINQTATDRIIWQACEIFYK